MLCLAVKETGITSWVLRNKKLVNIEDAYKDDRFDSSVDKSIDFVTTSMLATPVIYNDEVTHH
jgi:GAF domain-containing protein